MYGSFKVIVVISKQVPSVFLIVLKALVASERVQVGLISLLIIHGFWWPSWSEARSVFGGGEAASTSVSSWKVWSEVHGPAVPPGKEHQAEV